MDYGALLNTPGIEAVAKALPWGDYARRIEAVHQQLGDQEETFPYEVALDALYLDRLIGFIPRAGDDARPILRNRALREVVLWALRLRSYGYSFPEMVNILPDFRLLVSQEELRRMVEDSEGWRGIARLLSQEAAEELSRIEGSSVDVLGRLFDEDLVRAVRLTLVAYPFEVGIVVGYVYLKELELRRLIRALGEPVKGYGCF